MAEIRGASLAAHAAARAASGQPAVVFAARAAGQAVATAHVPQHAFGAAYYALKAIAAVDLDQAETAVDRELKWQVRRSPARLRPEVVKRLIVQKRGGRVLIKLPKDADF
jgi:hypothetical protein